MGITYIKAINIQVSSADKIEQVQSEVETLLRQRHHITNGKEDDFNVRNLTSLMETMTQTTTMLTLFLGSIAAISLVVGGIGIMNIMMVSVTERTREIGIRKAWSYLPEYHDAVSHRVRRHRRHRRSPRRRLRRRHRLGHSRVRPLRDGHHGSANHHFL